MAHEKYPEMLKALLAYGPNLYAQSQKTGIPYTTLREWFLYDGDPKAEKFAHLPDVLAAYARDLASRAESADPITA